MRILKVLAERIIRIFRRKKIESAEEIHWVSHIFDRTYPAHKAAAGGWCNVHGFAEQVDGKTIYWIGFDSRSFGFRVQDELVKCRSYELYKKYLTYGPKNWEIHNAIVEDPALQSYSGKDLDTKFIFKWGNDEEKSFNIAYSFDLYGEEKQCKEEE